MVVNENIIGLHSHLGISSVEIVIMVAEDLDLIKNTIFKEQSLSKIFSKGKENDNLDVSIFNIRLFVKHD